MKKIEGTIVDILIKILLKNFTDNIKEQRSLNQDKQPIKINDIICVILSVLLYCSFLLFLLWLRLRSSEILLKLLLLVFLLEFEFVIICFSLLIELHCYVACVSFVDSKILNECKNQQRRGYHGHASIKNILPRSFWLHWESVRCEFELLQCAIWHDIVHIDFSLSHHLTGSVILIDVECQGFRLTINPYFSGIKFYKKMYKIQFDFSKC